MIRFLFQKMIFAGVKVDSKIAFYYISFCYITWKDSFLSRTQKIVQQFLSSCSFLRIQEIIEVRGLFFTEGCHFFQPLLCRVKEPGIFPTLLRTIVIRRNVACLKEQQHHQKPSSIIIITRKSSKGWEENWPCSNE